MNIDDIISYAQLVAEERVNLKKTACHSERSPACRDEVEESDYEGKV